MAVDPGTGPISSLDVYDEDIEALIDIETATAQDRIRLVSLSIHRRHGFLPIMLVAAVAILLTLGRGMAPRCAVTYLAHCRGSQWLQNN